MMIEWNEIIESFAIGFMCAGAGISRSHLKINFFEVFFSFIFIAIES